MPRSIFSPHRSKSHRSKPVHVAKPVRPSVSPGSQLYEGINTVTSWLGMMQRGLDTTFSGAPVPLRIYIENAMLALHDLVDLMTSKQPEGTRIESLEYAPKTVEAAMKTLDNIAASIGCKVMAQKSNQPLEEKLLKFGVMDALHTLALGRSPIAKSYITLHGTLKTACMRLADHWEHDQRIVCENNRHDPEEYRDLCSSLQDDMDDAHKFINNL